MINDLINIVEGSRGRKLQAAPTHRRKSAPPRQRQKPARAPRKEIAPNRKEIRPDQVIPLDDDDFKNF